MNRKDKTLTVIGIAILFLMLCWYADADAQATDTYVGACAAQPACVLASNVSWVNGNQVWRFTAWQQNESIRIWIHNNNPTSAHTQQTVQVFITDEGNVANLTSNADRWVQAAVIDNSVAAAKCSNVAANSPSATPGANGKGTCYTVGMYAVQIAIRITGAIAQAGNPDTFDIGVVQQPTAYPGGPQPGGDSSTGGSANSSTTIPADGTSNSAITGPLAFGMKWNGFTWDRDFTCTGSTNAGTVFISALGAATTQIVGISVSSKIRICGVFLSNTIATPTNVKFVEGTGVNCAQGQTQLTGNIALAATPSFANITPAGWITNVGGDALCATGSAAGAVDITLTFTKY